MKKNWKTLILCIALPTAVGGLSALLTMGGMKTLETLNKPALAPPGWLFPAAWTILYILMGIASYLVVTSGKPHKTAPVFYGLQLAFNFFWPIIFFSLGQYLFAFIWLVIMWLLILITTYLFHGISEPAGYLMIPYLLWVAFAGCLNFSIYQLN